MFSKSPSTRPLFIKQRVIALPELAMTVMETVLPFSGRCRWWIPRAGFLIAVVLFLSILPDVALTAAQRSFQGKSVRPSISAAQQGMAPHHAALSSSGRADSHEASGTLRVASWGGGYMQSQKIAYFDPYSSQTGISVTAVKARGIIAALEALQGEAEADWDVVDLHQASLDRGCREGLLVPIDENLVIGGGKADFLPGAIHKCGVASMVWSSLIVYDKRRFRRRKPASVRDFFDIRRFPGRRALPDGPEYTLELALLADGVPSDEIYAALSTDEGLRRAFAKLDQIKKQVVWWQNGQQPLEALIAKKVSMALAFNGRVFQTAMRHPGRLGLIWQGQIYEFDFWAVPKRAPHRERALDFIKFALAPERQALQSRWFPYGPTRISALSMIGKHAELGVAMLPYIPTAKRNFREALQRNRVWWEANKQRLAALFADWKAGRPLWEADEAGE